MKKAQVTVFLIIGILIITVFFVSTTLTNNARTTPVLQQVADVKESLSVSDFVTNCIEKTLEEAIRVIGIQGGHYRPNFYELVDGIPVALYANVDYLLVPSLETIETELNSYIESNIQSCINHLDTYKSLGYSVNEGLLTASTKINENDVSATINYPIELTKKDSVIHKSEFQVTIPIDFLKVYEIVEEFMREQQSDLDSVHFGLLTDLAYDNNFFYEIVQLSRETVLYTLKFEDILLNNNQYVYQFTARYEWEDDV